MGKGLHFLRVIVPYYTISLHIHRSRHRKQKQVYVSVGHVSFEILTRIPEQINIKLGLLFRDHSSCDVCDPSQSCVHLDLEMEVEESRYTGPSFTDDENNNDSLVEPLKTIASPTENVELLKTNASPTESVELQNTKASPKTVTTTETVEPSCCSEPASTRTSPSFRHFSPGHPKLCAVT